MRRAATFGKRAARALRVKIVGGILTALKGPGPAWKAAGAGFQVREYRSYEEYVAHQSAKRERLGDLSEYERRFGRVLRERLSAPGLVKPGMTVLCLGARQGTEVEVFLELGCFALGIDLNPGPQNPHVVYGDFHEIGFPAGSADVIYSNSLDHALDIDRVIAGIRRVLKPDGLLVIEAVRGREEGQAPRFYESFFWSRIDDLVALLQRHGFRLLVRAPFSEPWAGDHLCFRGSS